MHPGSLSLTAQLGVNTVHDGPGQKLLLSSVPMGAAYQPLISAGSWPDPYNATHPKPHGMAMPGQPAYTETPTVSIQHLLSLGALAVPCAQSDVNP